MSGGTLVIGAGLAGLSAAWHLGRAATVLEASPTVGGLCRTYTRDGYTFDISGHLLHFRQPAIRRFVGSLVPGALARHRRRALVRFGRRWVHYPFQAHLFELPARARDECLRGFFKAAGEKAAGAAAPADFEGWLRHHFGDGIVRHFLGPYNRKMWRVPLRRIDPAWAAWAVPVPTPAQIQEAARPGADLRLGYNTVFEYPRAGGIGVLAAALAQGDFRLHLGEKVVGVDLGAPARGDALGTHLGFRAPRLDGAAAGTGADDARAPVRARRRRREAALRADLRRQRRHRAPGADRARTGATSPSRPTRSTASGSRRTSRRRTRRAGTTRSTSRRRSPSAPGRAATSCGRASGGGSSARASSSRARSRRRSTSSTSRTPTSSTTGTAPACSRGSSRRSPSAASTPSGATASGSTRRWRTRWRRGGRSRGGSLPARHERSVRGARPGPRRPRHHEARAGRRAGEHPLHPRAPRPGALLRAARRRYRGDPRRGGAPRRGGGALRGALPAAPRPRDPAAPRVPGGRRTGAALPRGDGAGEGGGPGRGRTGADRPHAQQQGRDPRAAGGRCERGAGHHPLDPRLPVPPPAVPGRAPPVDPAGAVRGAVHDALHRGRAGGHRGGGGARALPARARDARSAAASTSGASRGRGSTAPRSAASWGSTRRGRSPA